MAKMNETQTVANNVSLIGAGTDIKGEVNCASDLRVDGSVSGNVNVKGKLVIGNTGRIEGEVNCANGDISGHLNGKITVQNLLALKSSSRLEGDVITKKLNIEPGSVFNGTCAMGDVPTPTSGPSTKPE